MTIPAEQLHRIKKAILTASPQAEVILFGSQARGDAHENSDVDILILIQSDNATPSYEEKEAIIDALFNLEITLNLEINPVIRTRNQWLHPPVRTPFYINVMNEGLRV